MHTDLKGRSGGIKGMAASKSSKQRINSKISTELKIVGVVDRMPGVLCTLQFLEGGGFKVNDNTVY